MSDVSTWDVVELYVQSLDLGSVDRSLDLLTAVVQGFTGQWAVSVRLVDDGTVVARGGNLALHDVDARPEGPAAAAIATGAPVVVHDLTAPGQAWEDFARAAVAAGARAVASVPMVCAGVVRGAVTMYSPQPHVWSTADLAPVRVVADLTALAEAARARSRQQEEVVQQLQHALDSRVVIEQAKGMLAAREEITPQEAYERMRRLARQHSVTVHEVAYGVLRPPVPAQRETGAAS